MLFRYDLLFRNLEQTVTLDKRLLELEILYVEDDVVLSAMVTDALGMLGFKLTSARNGEEGLKCFMSKQFDIILSDINMPIMDGLAMSKAIREIDKTTPIVLLSAHNESEYLLQSISLGINGYLVKPAPVKDIIAQLAKVMEPIFTKTDFNENSKQWTHDLILVHSIAANLKSKSLEDPNFEPFFNERLDKIIFLVKNLSQSITKITG